MRSPRASPKNSPQASPAASPKQSPVTSPRAQGKHPASRGCGYRCVHGYLCGRVSLLHVSVVCVLLGITLLVVGLVQLAPGAGTAVNKYAIIGAGSGFLGLGFLLLILLCVCQQNAHRRRRHPPHLLQEYLLCFHVSFSPFCTARSLFFLGDVLLNTSRVFSCVVVSLFAGVL
ncbi:hypothetical protein Pmani_006135 [Petrolisthes manimaculis]|uniref:Uncharacterized protein n=1 Tax=Petrolisthes manimaculis TaxID=1843537 RepID=A0AAE1UFZ2_9EUCA|nr:hypothetical protein Pmani_006135 [Petrolisthes manimaculis]